MRSRTSARELGWPTARRAAASTWGGLPQSLFVGLSVAALAPAATRPDLNAALPAPGRCRQRLRRDRRACPRGGWSGGSAPLPGMECRWPRHVPVAECDPSVEAGAHCDKIHSFKDVAQALLRRPHLMNLRLKFDLKALALDRAPSAHCNRLLRARTATVCHSGTWRGAAGCW